MPLQGSCGSSRKRAFQKVLYGGQKLMPQASCGVFCMAHPMRGADSQHLEIVKQSNVQNTLEYVYFCDSYPSWCISRRDGAFPVGTGAFPVGKVRFPSGMVRFPSGRIELQLGCNLNFELVTQAPILVYLFNSFTGNCKSGQSKLRV